MLLFFVLLLQAVLFVYWKIEIDEHYTIEKEPYQGVNIMRVVKKEHNSWYLKIEKYDTSVTEKE